MRDLIVTAKTWIAERDWRRRNRGKWSVRWVKNGCDVHTTYPGTGGG